MKTAVPLGPDGRPLWYGRRRTHKLRPGRQRLVETLLPDLRIAVPPAGDGLDPASLFPRRVEDLRLEIGFGAGEHLSGAAKAAPEAGFIGCEPFVNGVASLLSDVERLGLDNVRVHDDDARLLLDALPDGCLSTIYVLFPDPWPKIRHHRRRLIQQTFLDQAARLTIDGGTLLFASDHMGYVAWTLAEMQRHPDWHWTAERPDDWRRPPADWVATRYEMKAIRKGLRPAYLLFRRRARA